MITGIEGDFKVWTWRLLLNFVHVMNVDSLLGGVSQKTEVKHIALDFPCITGRAHVAEVAESLGLDQRKLVWQDSIYSMCMWYYFS